MAIDAKKLLDINTCNVLTDKGYTTGKQIDMCSKNKIIGCYCVCQRGRGDYIVDVDRQMGVT